jgi:hypothetical protein
MDRKSLLLALLLIFGLAACAQTQTAPAVEVAAAPSEPQGAVVSTPNTNRVAATEKPIQEEPLEESPDADQAEALEETPETHDEEPSEAAVISNFALANMTYSNEFTTNGQVALSNGKYSEPAAPGSATETMVTLHPGAAFGVLDGQPVAASILVTDPGGSGTFYTLHVIGLDENDQPVELAYAFLGDRVEIDSVTIAYDQVTVELLAAGADDPLCCPTQQVVLIYKLWGDQLIQTASDVVGDLAKPLPSDLYYRLWTWQRSLDSTNQSVTGIEESKNYSLIFHEDGTFQYTADCNRGSGEYTADDQGAIRFHPREESFTDCGRDSHSQSMRATLGEARAYRRGYNTLSLVRGDESIVDIYLDSGPVVPEGQSLAISPEQIALSLQGIFETWTAVEVPARPVEPGSPPGSGGLPHHIEIHFDSDDGVQRNGGAIMYIIPVKAYTELWELAGDTMIKARIDAVYDFARRTPQILPTANVPVLPGIEAPGTNDLAAQIDHTGAGLNSASQTGYRFIGRITEDSSPVINQNLRYIYQGFTNGGKHLVAFFIPVNTAELPDFSADLPQEKIERFNSDAEGYLAAEASALSDLPADSWEPDLAYLDDLVSSLQIDGITPAGIKNITWAWTGIVTNPKTGDVTKNDLQGEYTALFQDYTLTFVADCIEDSRSYEVVYGGMVGEVAVRPAENGQVDCGAGSFSDEFINLLQEGGEYRVLPGGSEMILALPDGQAEYLLRDKNTPALAEAPAEETADSTEPAVSEQSTVSEEAAASPEADEQNAEITVTPAESGQGGAAAGNAAADQEPGSVRDLVSRGFSLDVEGAANSFEWQVVNAVPVGEGPNGIGFPSYILITFDGENAQEVLQTNGRHMRIFPIERYDDLYQAAGRTIIGEQTARLRELITRDNLRTDPPEGALPLLPPASGAVSRWTQYRAQDFASGSGVRYLSDKPDRQAIGVWSSDSTAYSFQGLTGDGRYYVSLWWPVSTSALPETAELASQDLWARAVDPLTNPAYIRETAEKLDALNPGEFTPRLSLLDTMVQSLQIGE